MFASIKSLIALTLGATILLSGCTTSDQQYVNSLMIGLVQLAADDGKTYSSSGSGGGGGGETVCGTGPYGGCR